MPRPRSTTPDVDVVISGEQQEADGGFDSPAYVLDAATLGIAKGWIMLGHVVSEEAGHARDGGSGSKGSCRRCRCSSSRPGSRSGSRSSALGSRRALLSTAAHDGQRGDAVPVAGCRCLVLSDCWRVDRRALLARRNGCRPAGSWSRRRTSAFGSERRRAPSTRALHRKAPRGGPLGSRKRRRDCQP